MSFFSATSFLYTGSSPIQTGVAPGTITLQQAAVIRGRVSDDVDGPVPGVTVSILGHPEFGSTVTRPDGVFDIAVNGGQMLQVQLQKTGFLPAQRNVEVPWQDYVWSDPVSLVALDSAVTTVNLNNPGMKVARANPVTDTAGTRRPTLLLPEGTQAELVFPNGNRQIVSGLNIRLTEYTVGSNGPRRMPATLPPTSAYTYCVELTADEVAQTGAETVEFENPIVHYVEDFRQIPVGLRVPVATYDLADGCWEPGLDGRVVKVLSVSGGLAEMDVDGSGQPASAAALAAIGIDNAERQQVASLYAPGQELFRVPVTHFSPHDPNYPFVPPDDAVKPDNEPMQKHEGPHEEEEGPGEGGGGKKDPCPPEEEGSVIEVSNQILGESIQLVGAPHSLTYASDRVPGRLASNEVLIHLTGASVPSSLKGVELTVTVAGRQFKSSHPPQPNQDFTFRWDGKDAYDRTLQGEQVLTARVGYVYDSYYAEPGPGPRSFGLASGRGIPGSIAIPNDYTIESVQKTTVGAWDARGLGLGGWSLSSHAVYDPGARVLHFGDGTRQQTTAVNVNVIETFADVTRSSDASRPPCDYAQASAISGRNGPSGVALAPDGTLYYSDTDQHRVFRRAPGQAPALVAGTGTPGFSGDGGAANQAQLFEPRGIALGRDGSLYIADQGNFRIRRVKPDATIETYAGTGLLGDSGDGGPALAAAISAYGLVYGPDCSLYFVDADFHKIRKIGHDGTIQTIAGTGQPGATGDGGPALEAQLNIPADLTFDSQGTLYVADAGNNRIRSIGPDGIIRSVAGNGTAGFSGDDGPAIDAQLNFPMGIEVTSFGRLVISDTGNHRIRVVTPEERILTVAGTGTQGELGDVNWIRFPRYPSFG